MEWDVKAKKSQRAMIEELLSKSVKWGNFDKSPAVSKEPFEIKIDANTVAYVSVIVFPKSQCQMCGTYNPDKADYCDICQGKVVADDSIAEDI